MIARSRPMYPRYAIYFAPSERSSLWRLGCAWLGRDAQRDCALEQPRLDGLAPARVAQLTAAPRLYGFHATLKPPFALAPGCVAGELDAALARFAQRRAPFPLPPLEVGMLAGFIALLPIGASAALAALAGDCV